MLLENIKKSITDISVKLSFTSCSYTVAQKLIMCDAFLKVAEERPEEILEYFSESTKRSNIQNKIFKKYLHLLESNFPIRFVKNGNRHIVQSLEDPDLNIFSGFQEFSAKVDKNGKIKNSSDNVYIGGRKSSIVKPYHIGKLLDAIDLSTGESILDMVDDYTFTWIKFKKVAPGTNVKVEHLAMPPHYQMGPMVYLNRIKSEVKKNL